MSELENGEMKNVEKSKVSKKVEKGKKQIPLRVSSELYENLARWAEDDFRSINGQIEYLLTECVKQRKSNGKYISSTMKDEFDI